MTQFWPIGFPEDYSEVTAGVHLPPTSGRRPSPLKLGLMSASHGLGNLTWRLRFWFNSKRFFVNVKKEKQTKHGTPIVNLID